MKHIHDASTHRGPAMTTGVSIFLIAAGAILRYAVTATVSGPLADSPWG